ncbi:hypothetical protein LIA77_01517 [Sarocladium implicatum]|nr:hypothetical protein LIA77_01517 [Sarocladium implicatum]
MLISLRRGSCCHPCGRPDAMPYLVSHSAQNLWQEAGLIKTLVTQASLHNPAREARAPSRPPRIAIVFPALSSLCPTMLFRVLIPCRSLRSPSRAGGGCVAFLHPLPYSACDRLFLWPDLTPLSSVGLHQESFGASKLRGPLPIRLACAWGFRGGQTRNLDWVCNREVATQVFVAWLGCWARAITLLSSPVPSSSNVRVSRRLRYCTYLPCD